LEYEFGDRLIDMGAGQPLTQGCGGFDAMPLADIFRYGMTAVYVISHRHAQTANTTEDETL